MRPVTAAAKVLVVEDDEAIGRSLEGVLLERGYAVERCLRGGDALLAADAFRPDLVLLDLGLPDLDGVEVCRRLRLGSPLLPIVMLTARGEEMDVVLGLSAGADDYVAKPFRLNELLARVAAQLRRSEGAAGAQLAVADITIDVGARTVRRGVAAVELRPREFDLLLLLAQNAGRVVTRERILAELWRDHWGGASKTLDMHMSTLRRRLGEPDLITTLRGVGYRIDVP
jgi:DNA-binding response OmpR family regulator